MNNQVLTWLMFIAPWFTLFLMRKEDLKRFMPVALFTAILSAIISDMGYTFGLWTIGEKIYPFSYLSPHLFGPLLVITLWVFKFTYGRFWLYMITNTILDIGFNFLFLGYFLPARGILFMNVHPIRTLPITLIHAAIAYGYQMWQAEIFAGQTERKRFSFGLQPAATKPLAKDQKDEEQE